MEKFIDFIIDLTNSELYECVDGDSKKYFLHGGCYEFVRILKKYVTDCKVVINTRRDHCGVLYKRRFYDATGIIPNVSEFKIADQADMEYMESFFGIPEKKYVGQVGNRKRISDFIIEEIADCNIDYILKEFEQEER